VDGERRLDLRQREATVPLPLLDEGQDVFGKLGSCGLRWIDQLGFRLPMVDARARRSVCCRVDPLVYAFLP